MKWRDLLYFSKGERRALTVLLSLIAAAWLTLIFTEPGLSPVSPDIEISETNLVSSSEVPDTTSKRPDGNMQKSIREKKQIPSKEKPIPSDKKRYSYQKKTDTLFKRFPKAEKFPVGTIVELNSADTTTLKKVPGIGSAFARRIVKYRELLGGFYSVGQLAEVYGIDEERYEAMKSWFSVELSAISQLKINHLSTKELASHPYVSYKQARVIEQLVHKKGKLPGWESFSLLEEFTELDRKRLEAYLSFE